MWSATEPAATGPHGQTPSTTPASSPSPRADALTAGKTVLIVEDDEPCAQALCILLRRSGWTVDVVATIAEANLYLDAHTPASIILDLLPPDGEGWVILDRVRRHKIASKVTVTTASTDPDRLEQVRALQPD